MIPVITGDNGELLDRAFPSFDGVVVVGYGTGNCPPGILPAVRRWLDAGKPVVLASRCIRGEVSATYAFPGAGGDLIRMGVLPAGPRAPSQARMELAICLSAGVSYGVRE
jgi:L-asparaginase